MSKHKLVRLTVDIPLDAHKKLKASAALSNQSMRDILVDLIANHLDIEKIKVILEKL